MTDRPHEGSGGYDSHGLGGTDPESPRKDEASPFRGSTVSTWLTAERGRPTYDLRLCLARHGRAGWKFAGANASGIQQEVEVRAEPQVFTRVFARSRDPTWTQSSRIHGVGHVGYSTPECVEGVEHVVPQGRKRSGTAPREER